MRAIKLISFDVLNSWTGDPYKVSIAMDAVNKCGHLAHAGNEVQLEPRVHHFFGKGRKLSGSLSQLRCAT